MHEVAESFQMGTGVAVAMAQERQPMAQTSRPGLQDRCDDLGAAAEVPLVLGGDPLTQLSPQLNMKVG